MSSKNLIICNGEIPNKEKIYTLAKESDLIICADGGANHAKSARIKPKIIIGDLDSIKNSTKKYYSNIEIIKIEDQNSTDLEKSLDYLISNKKFSATIIGATGKRIDHTLANISILLKYHLKGMKLKIIEKRFEIFVATKYFSAITKIGKTISLIPITKCIGIKTSGLKYTLKSETLCMGVREGVSNVAVKKNISVKIKTGALAILIQT